MITVAGVDYVFSPRVTTVKVGTKVTWIDRTTTAHTVTAVNPKDFDMSVGPDEAVTLVPHQPGRYPYYCRFYPYMRGVVIITS